MERTVEDIIDGLKAKFDAKSDSQLARNLEMALSTVCTWRKRGRVPEKWVRVLDEDANLPSMRNPKPPSDVEKAVLSLALFRYSRAFHEPLNGGEFGAALRVLANAPEEFAAVMAQARTDILKLSDIGSPAVAMAVLMSDDMSKARSGGT